MKAIRQFLSRIKRTGVKHPGRVKTTAMGREREFVAYEVGNDTFIFEVGISKHLEERPSVLVVNKADLRRRTKGRVMTMTTGNHSVAAFPLLDGRFWQLSKLPSARRSEVLMRHILCCNIVRGTIEVSQRDVSTRELFAADEWLLSSAGFTPESIVLCERNEAVLQHYRRCGNEWRVKPLAWTENEMKTALAACRKRISSKLRYYHSARGVHFLAFDDFAAFAKLAREDGVEFINGLKELVSVFEGNRESFTRMPKHRGHHEIEFFGLRRGVALEKLIPELEGLMEAIALGRIGGLGIIQKAEEIVELYRSLLTQPELANSQTKKFTETLYIYVTGEIYSVIGEGSTPAFDDRRTALPGATFIDGRPVFAANTDQRSRVLLSNLRGLLSKDEVVEYANVYELRDDDSTGLGQGKTREIVYKTSRHPLERSLIEKRLANATKGYGAYMLSRIGAMRALGIAMSPNYMLLKTRSARGRRSVDFYIRERCEGEPIDSIPQNYFCSADDSTIEEKEVVLAMATLMGDAAAQNMAVKKFDPKSMSPLYGVGKEIYEFEYDIIGERIVPKKVATCSIRGSFGWPCLEETDENLARMAHFYLSFYAHSLKEYQRRHQATMAEVAERFWSGFEFRTHALEWQLTVMRDQFEAFHPPLPKHFDFDAKWRFVMWSLERQERRLRLLKKMFFEKVEVVENEGLRDNPQ